MSCSIEIERKPNIFFRFSTTNGLYKEKYEEVEKLPNISFGNMKSDNLFVHWSETQLSLIASLRYIEFAFIYQIIYSALDCRNVSDDLKWMNACVGNRSRHQHQHRRISLNEFTICVSFWHLHFSDRVNICCRNWSSPSSCLHPCVLHELN